MLQLARKWTLNPVIITANLQVVYNQNHGPLVWTPNLDANAYQVYIACREVSAAETPRATVLFYPAFRTSRRCTAIVSCEEAPKMMAFSLTC